MIRALTAQAMLLAGVLLFSNNAFSEKTCVSKEEMQEIASHFTQFEPYAQAEYCLDGSEISNLLDSLLFMRKTSFKAPMERSHDELFSGRFQNDWYGYFIGRISEIEIDRGCPKGVGAYVYGFFGSKMYVCTMILTSNFTSLDRASVFMHEARHIDGFPHTTCTHGARAGMRGACDRQISEGGSYAVSVETYAQIAKYATDLHPALRAYARAAAVTYADEAFEHPVTVDRFQGLVVLDNEGSFHKVSKSGHGQLTTEKIGQIQGVGKIVPRAEQLILFPADTSELAGYVFPRGEGKISQQAGEIARIYNELSPAEKALIVDSHIAAQWSAQIQENAVEFYCNPGSDQTSKITLPGGKEPLGFVYPEGYSRAASSVLISFDNGEVYEAGCQNTSQGYLRATGKTYSVPMKRIHRAGSFVLGVDLAGSLYELVNDQPVLIQAGGIGFAFEIAPYGSFDFFDL